MPVRGKSTVTVVDLLLRYIDDFVPASEAAENPDLALGDVKMLCQQFDDCQIGPALPGWLLDLDCKAIPFLANFLGLRIGLHLNLNFHFITIISRIVMVRNRERDSDC